MNLKNLYKYIQKNYYKDKQSLKLASYINEEHHKKLGNYFFQEIMYKDYVLFAIQTWSNIPIFSIPHSPYCLFDKYETIFTVPKFGMLKDEDIYKAIYYYLEQLESITNDMGLIFNIYLDGKMIEFKRQKNYKLEETQFDSCRLLNID